MRVLVACEESQTVCKAFRAAGHEAFSADIQECSGGHPEWHIQGDVLEVLDDGWDMMIAHPECRYLCLSGARWFGDERYPNRYTDRTSAIKFFQKLQRADIKKIAIENSTPSGYTLQHVGRYDQLLQPYHFGTPVSKALCWWLKNLPPLIPTHSLADYDEIYPECHMEPPGPERSKNRSKTDPNVADALALQWGNQVEPEYREGTLFA